MSENIQSQCNTKNQRGKHTDPQGPRDRVRVISQNQSECLKTEKKIRKNKEWGLEGGCF